MVFFQLEQNGRTKDAFEDPLALLWRLKWDW